MSDREKLIELIGNTKYGYGNGTYVGKNFQRGFIEKIADHLISNGVTVQKWIPVSDVQDLPKEDGEYLVALHRVVDFFGEPDEKIMTTSAYFYYEQKIWEITPYNSINALLPIFDVFDTFTTDYIDHWMPLPEPPKECE